MYCINPVAGHIVNFIFGVSALFFALVAVTNAAYKKGRRLTMAVVLMGLSLFLTSSFDTVVSNPHLTDAVRSQAFRKELMHQGLLCIVAAVIYYGLRVRPQQTSNSRLKGWTV